MISRRTAVAAALAMPFVSRSAHANTPIRFTLDWKYQGVHSWFYVSQDKGYFREEGLDVRFDQGEGSAATISRIMTGTYDAGFGDINAVIVAASQKPEIAPRLIYEMYNRGPTVLAVRANGPIRALKDIEGRKIGAPAGSASVRLLPLLARLNGIDIAKVQIVNVAANLQEPMLASGDVDGILGFNYSIYTNLPQARLDPDRDVRWFGFSEYGLDLYSNGVMASQALIRKDPDAVRRLVRAIHRGFRDTVADTAGAIATLKRVEPLLNADVEKRRLDYTLRHVMVTDWTRANGFGGVDPQKLATGIQAIVEGYGLSRRPEPGEIFDASFLPPAGERAIEFPS